MGIAKYALSIDSGQEPLKGKNISSSSSNLILLHLKTTGESLLTKSAIKKWADGKTMTIFRQHSGALAITPTEIYISSSIDNDTLPFLVEHISTVKDGTVNYRLTREDREAVLGSLGTLPQAATDGNGKIWYMRVSKWEDSNNPVQSLIRSYRNEVESNLLRDLKEGEVFREMVKDQNLEYYLTSDEQRKMFAGTSWSRVNQAAEADKRGQRSLADIQAVLAQINSPAQEDATGGTALESGGDVADSVDTMASSTAMEVFEGQSTASSITSTGAPPKESIRPTFGATQTTMVVTPSQLRKPGEASVNQLASGSSSCAPDVAHSAKEAPSLTVPQSTSSVPQQSDQERLPKRVQQLRSDRSTVLAKHSQRSLHDCHNKSNQQESSVTVAAIQTPSVAPPTDRGFIFSLSGSRDVYLGDGDEVCEYMSDLIGSNPNWTRSSVGQIRDLNVQYTLDDIALDMRHLFNGQPDFRVTCRETYMIPDRPYSRTVIYHMSKQDLQDTVGEMVWARDESVVSKIDWIMFQQELEEVDESRQTDMEACNYQSTLAQTLHTSVETWWKLIEGQLKLIEELQAELRASGASSGEPSFGVVSS